MLVYNPPRGFHRSLEADLFLGYFDLFEETEITQC